MLQTRHLYNMDGHWVAFLVGGDLFWRDGERLGWLKPVDPSEEGGWSGGVVSTECGEQIGLITEHGVIELYETAAERRSRS